MEFNNLKNKAVTVVASQTFSKRIPTGKVVLNGIKVGNYFRLVGVEHIALTKHPQYETLKALFDTPKSDFSKEELIEVFDLIQQIREDITGVEKVWIT